MTEKSKECEHRHLIVESPEDLLECEFCGHVLDAEDWKIWKALGPPANGDSWGFVKRMIDASV